MDNEMRKMIDKFENFSTNKSNINESVEQHHPMVGYHCSNNPNLEGNPNYPNLGTDDYWEWHELVLEVIADKVPKAEEYIERIQTWDGEKWVGEDLYPGEKLTSDINEFFTNTQIKGIFVNELEPISRWGKYCYRVYFKDIEFERIQDFKMVEEGEEHSFLYVFKNSNPIFEKIK